MGDFREHGVLIYLDKDLYRAFIRLQADKELGRSYAGLLAFTEGVYHMGYVTKEVYQFHVDKYSERLATEVSMTAEQISEKRELEVKDGFFKQVLEQWVLHDSSEWRGKMVKQAEEWKDKLESARMVVQKRGSMLERALGHSADLPGESKQ